MLAIAPGVYIAPKMNRAGRERVWAVLEEWFFELDGGGIVMTRFDPLAPGGQQIAILGSPSYEFYPCNEIFLARKPDLRVDDD